METVGPLTSLMTLETVGMAIIIDQGTMIVEMLTIGILDTTIMAIRIDMMTIMGDSGIGKIGFSIDK